LQPIDAIIGDPDEQRAFLARHQLFFERQPNLTRACDLAFARTLLSEETIDHVLFALGQVCAEDFNEIIVLGGNGYGQGALKILRGLFENAVGARYLDEFPLKVDDFLEYHKVGRWKLVKSLESVVGEGKIPVDMREKAKREYEAVRGRFESEKCAACGKRPYRTWAEPDLVTMANRYPGLKALLPTAYYEAMPHTHVTASKVVDRLEPDGEGLRFSRRNSPGHADHALTFGHAVLLDVLDLQRSRFNPDGLAEALQLAEDDFKVIWRELIPPEMR
jgi:hypothetical protein